MTTFDILESGREASRPIELYEFILGAEIFRFASTEDDIVVGPNTFIGSSISRGRIKQGSDQANRNLTITMPSTEPFAKKYVTIPPGERASISIFRYQRDEIPSFNTQVLVFKGFLKSTRFPDNGNSTSLICRSIESALNRSMPRFTFMGMCQHILYDLACGALASNFDHFGTATSVVGLDITVGGLSASGLDVVGGYIRPTAEVDFRTIISQSGDVVTLNIPFANDPSGANMQVFAGCDHLIAGDCALVFDRVADFGGFPFVPSKDIFATGVT